MIRKVGLIALLGLLFVGFFSSSASAYEHGGMRGGYGRGYAPARRYEPVRRQGYGWGWQRPYHHHRYYPYYPYYRAW